MILLVCGGRAYVDYEAFCAAMRGLPFRPEVIIQGGARGADALAKAWARENGVHCAEVPALWNTFGKAAGSKRNAAMLALAPGYCLAMPGGAGTADMVRRCIDSKITVWEPYKWQ